MGLGQVGMVLFAQRIYPRKLRRYTGVRICPSRRGSTTQWDLVTGIYSLFIQNDHGVHANILPGNSYRKAMPSSHARKQIRPLISVWIFRLHEFHQQPVASGCAHVVFFLVSLLSRIIFVLLPCAALPYQKPICPYFSGQIRSRRYLMSRLSRWID